MKHRIALAATLALGACQQDRAAPPASAAAVSAAAMRGQALAKATCAACHGVDRDAVSSPNPQAPAFAAIANQQELTADSLSAWLRDAHNYPSDMAFELDLQKADDLVAYMLTLRDPDYRPIG